jgi:Ca2+-binding EF-hand superfamily protein
MAIQRLHKQKVYSQGSKRLMNLAEFIQTMEFSLNPIDAFGSLEIYQLLFSEVDLDKDGYISYEDYFVFLKEYFGTLSAIYDQDPSPKPQPEPVPNTNLPDFSIDNRATERFAKLVYSQLKITVMQLD